MSTGKNKSFAWAMLSVSFVLCVFRSALIISYMEKTSVEENSYYLPSNAVVILFGVVTAVCGAACVAAAMTIGVSKISLFSVGSSSSSIAALICAFTLACQFVMYLVMTVAGTVPFSALETVVYLLGLLSALFYFLRLGRRFNREEQSPEKFSVPALLPIAYFALRLLNDFIKTSAAPMESSGAYHILSLCAAMLFFLCDGQSSIKKTGALKFFAFGGIGVMLLAVYAVPNIVIRGTGLLCFDFYAVSSISDVCFLGYIATRLISSRIVPRRDPDAAE